MFSDKRSTADARQIRITGVAKGSPADGVLAVGEVILGMVGKPFSHDSRTEFGKALIADESEAGGGRTEEVMVKLHMLGANSAMRKQFPKPAETIRNATRETSPALDVL